MRNVRSTQVTRMAVGSLGNYIYYPFRDSPQISIRYRTHPTAYETTIILQCDMSSMPLTCAYAVCTQDWTR